MNEFDKGWLSFLWLEESGLENQADEFKRGWYAKQEEEEMEYFFQGNEND